MSFDARRMVDFGDLESSQHRCELCLAELKREPRTDGTLSNQPSFKVRSWMGTLQLAGRDGGAAHSGP
jgi:hypothetical protein